jgi:superfamily II DNA or RNA helicase
LEELPKKQMGNAFELLTKLYFKINPVYSFYDEVWLLSEVPQKVFEYLGLPSHDLGIDLIAKYGDEYHPIQCKYHSDKNSSITFNEVSTFISLLEGNDKFTQGYICSTANGTSKNLDKIRNKHINLILSDSWLSLDDDFFNQVRNYFEDRKYTPVAYSPKEHQVKALKDSVEYFINGNNTRGKLIFPCGAGKSLTGFWMTQELKSTSTIIAVPSLSLVKQTLDVYLREIVARGIKVKWLCICSDEGIGKDDEILEHTESLGIPCQTDPEYIENWLEANRNEHKIIFTTYQSGRIIADVSKKLNISFDLGIFDEAHKTVGLNKKLFSYLLFEENITIERRIFMTATERFYSGSKEDIISMDDYEIYGDTFSQMSFKEAIDKELLTDYKVITIDVKKSEIAEFIKSNNLVQLNNKWKNETEARSLASMIALRKAMKVLPIRNAVSFHSSIERAERNKELQQYITDAYEFEPIESFTVSSKIPTTKRNDIIQEFAQSNSALITNAKCLTEGVDVPNIDCIVFADPRKSKVDIVQALGRALRKKKGKDWGYVILPVLYDDETHEIDNENYTEIISIIRGLAANDERIVEYFKDKSDKNGSKRIEGSSVFDFNFTADLLDEKELTAQLQIKIWESLSKFQWMPFEEAREFIRGLGFNNIEDWKYYVKSQNKPHYIPNHPNEVYFNKGWLSFGDWLGTNRVANKFLEFEIFEIARQYVWNLNLKSVQEWNLFRRNKLKPKWLPSNPNIVYNNNGWISWQDWLGTKRGFDGSYLLFKDARDLIRNLKIKSQNEWRVYTKSGEKPHNIPVNPNKVYLNKGWNGFGDWLGTERKANFNKVYQEFDLARKYIHSLNLKTTEDWLSYRKSNNKRTDIPTNPNITYKNSGWRGLKDWLGTEIITDYLDFETAKMFVQKLNFKNINAWRVYSKSEDKPLNIPNNPNIVYKNNGWLSFRDWIGIEAKHQKYLTFKEARDYIINIKLISQKDWLAYCNSDKKPSYIPKYPEKVYKNTGFKNLGDWLGTNIVSNKNKEFMRFEDARVFAHSLKLNSANQWKDYCKSGEKPIYIPSIPEKTYKNSGWISYGDWLNTNNIQSGNIKYREFIKAREFVRSLNLKSNSEWNDYSKSHKIPIDIPANPMSTYKKTGWLNMGDWLGTNRLAYGSVDYMNFEDVKSYAKKNNINSKKEWEAHCLSGLKPNNIPKTLHYTYKTNWKGWADFLGKDS